VPTRILRATEGYLAARQGRRKVSQKRKPPAVLPFGRMRARVKQCGKSALPCLARDKVDKPYPEQGQIGARGWLALVIKPRVDREDK